MMSMDLQAIVEQYSFEFEGKKCVYIPYKDSKRHPSLIVAMSTHNFGDRYYFIRGLIESQKASLLFVTDPDNTYYFEDDKGKGYERLFSIFIEKYGAPHVTFFGSSMSGYAAIYYGFKLKANVIASNPQINFDISYEHAWNDLRITLDRVKPFWVDIDVLFQGACFDSVFYIVYGDFPMDIKNIDFFQKKIIGKGRIYYEKMEDKDHGFYLRDPNQVFKVHTLINFARNNIFLKK